MGCSGMIFAGNCRRHILVDDWSRSQECAAFNSRTATQEDRTMTRMMFSTFAAAVALPLFEAGVLTATVTSALLTAGPAQAQG
jgi:hypothetical protein